MKKLLLMGLCAVLCFDAFGQNTPFAAFVRSLESHIHPRKDIAFYHEKAELTDSITGKKTSVRTFYYFHKPTQTLRLVAVHRTEEGSKYPVVNDYVFRDDSLQKIGVFTHPKLCKNCYGLYSFSGGQLTGKKEKGIPAEDTHQLLMNALEYQLKAALFFKEPTQ
jgi:hypothetical protein